MLFHSLLSLVWSVPINSTILTNQMVENVGRFQSAVEKHIVLLHKHSSIIDHSDSFRAHLSIDAGEAEVENCTVSTGRLLDRFPTRGIHIDRLSSLENPTRLKVSGTITDISELSELSGLSSLYITSLGTSEIALLSQLQNLTHLKIVFVDNVSLDDLSALHGLTHLEHLELVGGRISEISSLVRLPCLTSLALSKNDEILDLDSLGSLTRLRALSLEANNLENISFVSSLSKLEYLDLSSPNIENLEPLSLLTSIKNLSLSGSFRSLSPLSSLSGISGLRLSSTYVLPDISVIEIFTHLEFIKIYSAVEDLSALLSLTSHVSIELNEEQISDDETFDKLVELGLYHRRYTR